MLEIISMDLFTRIYGEGKPIIILHGLFGISDNWVTFARMMSAGYKIFLPDLRNHGQSPHSSVMNYQSMAEDLREFISSHNIVDPIIIGHSMGGKVAMKFALEYPEIPEILIIIDISTRAYAIRNTHLDVSGAMLSVDFDSISTRKEIEDQIGSMINDPKIQLFILKNLYRPNSSRFSWRSNIEAITENLDYLTEGITSKKQFGKPVLFVRGGESDYITDDDITPISTLFPEFQLETIENASHWIQADTPIRLHEIISRFILEN